MSQTATKRAFRLLGIRPTDDQVAIRRAWRQLVRRYHPDLARADRAAANRKLAEINEAFEIVMTAAAERKRADHRHAARAADVARRMAAARRAEARRQAEAREAEAERRAQEAHAAREAARAAQEARARAAAEARARREAASARSAMSGQDIASRRSGLSEHAARSFAHAIKSFSPAPRRARHDTTC